MIHLQQLCLSGSYTAQDTKAALITVAQYLQLFIVLNDHAIHLSGNKLLLHVDIRFAFQLHAMVHSEGLQQTGIHFFK